MNLIFACSESFFVFTGKHCELHFSHVLNVLNVDYFLLV